MGASVYNVYETVLLDEHEVQKRGDRVGLEAMLGQRTDLGLGPL